jgi:DNA-binding NarL/FixJ family response regulator
MIRILIVDDHPALRAGLQTVLKGEPGLVPVGSAAGHADVGPALSRTRPDLVLLDYHLPSTDGMLLCHRIKATIPTPHVILYSAYAGASMTVPATLAGVDAVISKTAPAEELFAAIRAVASGELLLPPASPGQFSEAATQLRDADLPIFAMVMDRTPPREIAETLGLETKTVSTRIERMLRRFKIEVPAAAG